MNDQKIVIDTDVLLDHLVHRDGPSFLRRAMNVFFCYTTAFNAIEAFSFARSDEEIQAVDDAMSAMKVLGLNAKSAKVVGSIFSKIDSTKKRDLAVLIAGVCRESKLPIVTMNPQRFSGIKQLRVITAVKLARYLSPTEIIAIK
ncbi:MAG: type II toxin-antitoxin system VapC family toxin [Bacteroidota bacterium]